jgi:hypothetical protein
MIERKKNKNHDELDGDSLISAAPRLNHISSVTKSTPFADISFRVDEIGGTLTQRSRRRVNAGLDD